MATTPICSTEFDPNFPDYFPSTSTSTSQNFVYPETSTKLKTTSKSKPRKNKRSGKLRNEEKTREENSFALRVTFFHIFLLCLSTPFKLLRLTMTMDGEMGVKQLCLLLTINDIFMSTDGYSPAVLPSLLLIDHRFSFR